MKMMKIELMCEVCDEVCEVVEVDVDVLSEEVIWSLLGIVVCDVCRVKNKKGGE